MMGYFHLRLCRSADAIVTSWDRIKMSLASQMTFFNGLDFLCEVDVRLAGFTSDKPLRKGRSNSTFFVSKARLPVVVQP